MLSAGFYPRLLALFLGVLAVLLIMTSVAKKAASTEETPPVWQSKKSFRLFLLILGALIAYPFVMTFSGFALTGFLFILTRCNENAITI